jgi:hypothetical protein
MDDKQKRLARNIVSGVILVGLLLFVAAYCGVFEGAQSDEAQIRALIERASDEISDHDWEDLFALCDLTPAEKQAWIDAVPAQAQYVSITSATPSGLINVPAGATEYQLDVSVVAQYGALGLGPQLDTTKVHLVFVKKNDRWYIDINNPKTNFGPYVNKPKMPN